VKQIVILSGKGGTGKTTVTAAFAHLSSQDEETYPILVDADVDAANLELLLAPHPLTSAEFLGADVAWVMTTLCTGCGRCVQVCRFDAVDVTDGQAHVRTTACEGCAACETQCPEHAIVLAPRVTGKWFFSDSRYGPLYHAWMGPGQENSGRLVTLLRQEATAMATQNEAPLIIVDGPPGTGCPAIAAMTGTDMVVAVTEPTAAGIHDLKRVLDLAAHFRVRVGVVINKADLYPPGTDQITEFCRQQGLDILGALPFDLTVTEAMVQGQTITAYRPTAPISRALQHVWQRVVSTV